MKVPDLSSLYESKVALRMTKAIKSEVRTEQYLTEDGMADFEIRSAVEVKMDSPDASDIPIDIDFTWEITKFTDSEANI